LLDLLPPVSCCRLRCLVVFQFQGMEYLHAKNIVHFDLKTANLLVGMRVSEAVRNQRCARA
jgi:serine/threonine protein kinase